MWDKRNQDTMEVRGEKGMQQGGVRLASAYQRRHGGN